MNAPLSQFFDQLQLLGLFSGANPLTDSINTRDLFSAVTSSAAFPMSQSIDLTSNHTTTSSVPTSLPQAANLPNIGGNDFASLAASLNLNLNSSDNGSQNPIMDSVDQAAVAAFLAATSNGLTGGSPGKSMDSYCEICNKQLCNRYFLKTHKLKKHGISEDGTSVSPMKQNFGTFNLKLLTIRFHLRIFRAKC